jgi:hypothetical protein
MTQLHPPHPHHDQQQQLRACSYGSWQPRYASLAHDSVVLPLAADVVAFLLEDGLVLPDASDAVSALCCTSWPLLLGGHC